MSRDLNMWCGIGRLGKDPECRALPSGGLVANFSIACGDDYFNKESGEKVERTEWVRVVAFGRLAEIIQEYCTAGKQVFIKGKLQTRKWQDKDGNDRYTTEVNASDMQLLGGRSDGAENNDGERPARTASAPKKSEEPLEDDIPF
jgi:single-strand DNA-binding protein